MLFKKIKKIKDKILAANTENKSVEDLARDGFNCEVILAELPDGTDLEEHKLTVPGFVTYINGPHLKQVAIPESSQKRRYR